MSRALEVLLSILAIWLMSALITTLLLNVLLSLETSKAVLVGAMVTAIPTIWQIDYFFGMNIALGAIISFAAGFACWYYIRRKK